MPPGSQSCEAALKKKEKEKLHWMLYHNGFLDGFLNLHAFSRDGLIQFPLKGQQVHVGLRLGDQVSNLRAAHQGSVNHSAWNESAVWVQWWKSSHPLWENLVSHLAPLCPTVREKQFFFSLIICNKLFLFLFTHLQNGTGAHAFSCHVFSSMTASGYLALSFIDLQSFTMWLWPHLTPSKFKLIQKVASSLQDSILPLYLRRQQLHCATVCRRSVASKLATFMSVASLNDLKSKILGGVCCLVSKAQSWDTLSSCLCAFNSTQTVTNRLQGGAMYSEVKVVV